MLLEPTRSDLDACISEALRLNRRRDNPTEMQAPRELLTLSESAQKTCILEYKIYVMFIWMIIHPSIQRWFSKGVEPTRFAFWFSMLSVHFDMHLFGLKVNGGHYTYVDTELARVGVFVRTMATIFSDS